MTIYIEGYLTTSGSTFLLANTDSSLTIFMTGIVDIGTQSNIFADKFVTTGTDGIVRTPLTIYSSNATDNALDVQGNGKIYANFYAPSGTVAYNGGGDLMGAIRAKEVDISGNGGIHYDEGLEDIGSSGNSEAKTSFSSVYYYYPDEIR